MRCVGASATCSSTRPRTSTRSSTGCVDLLRAGRDDLFLVGDPAQAIYGFNGTDPDAARRRRAPLPRHRDRPAADEPPLHAADRRCRRCTCSTGASSPPSSSRADPTAPRCSDRRARPTRKPRRPRSPRLVATGDPTLVRTGRGRRAGRARTPSSRRSPRRSRPPACRPPQRGPTPARRSRPWSRQVAALGSASQLRAWAHDALDGRSTTRRDRPRRATDGRRPDQLGRAPRSTSSATPRSVTEPVPGVGRHHRPVRRRHDRRRRGADVPRLEGPRVAHGGARRRRDEPRSAPLGDDRGRPRPRRRGCSTSPSPGPPTAGHRARRNARGGYARTPSPFIDGSGHRRARARSPAAATSPRPRRPDARGCSRTGVSRAGPPARRPPDRAVPDRDLAAIARPSSDDRRPNWPTSPRSAR